MFPLNMLNWTSTSWNKNRTALPPAHCKNTDFPELFETNGWHQPSLHPEKGEQRPVNPNLSLKKGQTTFCRLHKQVRNMTWCIHSVWWKSTIPRNPRFVKVRNINRASRLVQAKMGSITPFSKKNSRHRSGHPNVWSKVGRLFSYPNRKFRNIDACIHFTRSIRTSQFLGQKLTDFPISQQKIQKHRSGHLIFPENWAAFPASC